MSSQKREDLKVRMLAALEAGERQLLKWSAEVWTRGRHLFGAVCDEQYRRGFAQQLLLRMGQREALEARLQESAADSAPPQALAGNRRTSAPTAASLAQPQERQHSSPCLAPSEHSPPPASLYPPLPSSLNQLHTPCHTHRQPYTLQDAVERELHKYIERRHVEGELAKEWGHWGMEAHMEEWLLLATEPAGDTQVSPVLSEKRTPGLYSIYIDMLFVGLSDNTILESYVSRYKTFAHVNSGGLLVETQFLYHEGLEADRKKLRQVPIPTTVVLTKSLLTHT